MATKSINGWKLCHNPQMQWYVSKGIDPSTGLTYDTPAEGPFRSKAEAARHLGTKRTPLTS